MTTVPRRGAGHRSRWLGPEGIDTLTDGAYRLRWKGKGVTMDVNMMLATRLRRRTNGRTGWATPHHPVHTVPHYFPSEQGVDTLTGGVYRGTRR